MSYHLIASLVHPWVQSIVTTWSGSSLAALGMGVVAMGLLDFLGGDEPEMQSGDGDGDDGMMAGGDVMFDEESDGDFGDFDGMDGGMAEFGNTGGGGDVDGQLESRIEDLENELEDVSATMSTVRGENEQISETVEKVEENVRKLLEIYEMVTRGVNPFVDDVQSGSGGAGGFDSGSLDVFDDGDGDSDDGGEIDASISEADAESFFDEDLVDEEDEEAKSPMADAPFPGEEIDDGTDGMMDELAEDGDQDEKSFEELKEEYDADEADLSDPVMEDDSQDGTVEADSEPTEGTIDARDPVDSSVGGDEHDDSDEADFEFEPASERVENGTAADGSGSKAPAADGDGSTGGFDFGAKPAASGLAASKPYLPTLPNGYVADLVVIEWLNYLLEASSRPEAIRALGYYRDIEWVGQSASRALKTVLFELEARSGESTGDQTDGRLTMEHHLTSLQYIVQLANGTTMLPLPVGSSARGEVVDGV